MKLSILIPSTSDRKEMLDNLTDNLIKQITHVGWTINKDVEILIDERDDPSIGEKRNWLLNNANGDYLCFFDSDDLPTFHYIRVIKEGISKNPDCLSLRGIITTDGNDPQIFEHSIKYKEYKTTENEIKYERYPNHLNVIKSSIAKQFKFKEINHGEDTDWATQIHASGLLKKEIYSDRIIYRYLYNSKK